MKKKLRLPYCLIVEVLNLKAIVIGIGGLSEALRERWFYLLYDLSVALDLKDMAEFRDRNIRKLPNLSVPDRNL